LPRWFCPVYRLNNFREKYELSFLPWLRQENSVAWSWHATPLAARTEWLLLPIINLVFLF
jgi:hypothetical protein